MGGAEVWRTGPERVKGGMMGGGGLGLDDGRTFLDADDRFANVWKVDPVATKVHHIFSARYA